MSCGSIEVRPAIRGNNFIDLPERNRADQYAITLDQHAVGCDANSARRSASRTRRPATTPSNHAKTALDSA